MEYSYCELNENFLRSVFYEFIKIFTKGADVSIYAHKCKGILFNVLTPISDEEVGVV